MAREYARYLTKTHRDDDWHRLTSLQHDAYMALTSCEDITWAGVVPYAPSRFVGFSADMANEKKVEKTWAELAERGYLVIDKRAGELLIRTFVKHDNVIAKPNLTKAMIAAYNRVRSQAITQAINRELAKLYRDAPTLAGWKQIEERLPELFAELFLEPLGA